MRACVHIKLSIRASSVRSTRARMCVRVMLQVSVRARKCECECECVRAHVGVPVYVCVRL